MMKYVIFASGGNDSIALVDFAHVKKLKEVVVCYSNTGWASPSWPERISKFREYVTALGFDFVETKGE